MEDLYDIYKDFYDNREKYECNICGRSDYIPFEDEHGNKHYEEPICPICGSYSRTRVAKLFIDMFFKFEKNSQIIHFAPEPGLYDYLEKNIGVHGGYYPFDLTPSYKSTKKFNLVEDLEKLPSNSIDLILHFHVIEHIPCNYSYLFYHFHRILKNSGLHIFCVPFVNRFYHENLDVTLTDEYRYNNFGQSDHIRAFGIDDLHNTLGKIIRLPLEYDIEKIFGEEILKKFAIRYDCWKGFGINNVLCLKKNDYLLK